ncbi:YraN family protein [Allosediminivita pacifica]|uniref:UPF0102 protein C8N44_12159 n=1 Tax=Allosediminivita pacifica TaxID=1267769 RepID=A0A2T6AP15_9RHOB|nr:YraN family protein [Allosediminivita pacifica]PTX45537.1 putative endonuclease [Allosediminivita pacifica]GGB20225.1 UPF0102 protein [Allosediminivita pacifica]
MPFDVMPDAGRQLRGLTSYHAGCAAEDGVAAEYERQGCTVLRRRWRGRAGEIDLIAEKDGALIFVEVKKSRSFAAAAARITTRQVGRIFAAAEEYAFAGPRGSLTDFRVDLALVDAHGSVELRENAFAWM